MCPVFPSALPLPLLTLRLSSPSFLDTVLVDPTQSDETGNPIPLFTLETIDNHTTLYLCDSNTNTNNAGLTRLASIQWPTSTASGSFAYSNPYASTPNLGKGGKGKASPMIFLGDETGLPATALLKKSLLGGSKKFYVPGQSSPLKWKRVGSHYECTLCTHACTAHRAVALYERPHTTSNGRLSIYTSNLASHQQRSERLKGVDMEMLVYIIITSILMVTPIDAWKNLSGHGVEYEHEQVHDVEPKGLLNLRGALCTPSPISPKANFKIDLLAPDEAFLPSTPQSNHSSHSGLMGLNMSMSMRRSSTRRSTRSSRSSNTSSSIPSSPITPFTDLSHDLPGPSTFITTPVSSTYVTPYTHSGNTHSTYSHGSPSLLTTNINVSRRKSTKLPSPLITSLCPEKDVSGPGAITPYYLPPTPVHAPPTTPPSPTLLSPTNTAAYPYTMPSSSSPTQRTPTQYNVHHHHHITYPMSTNALLLSDVQHTSELIPTPRHTTSQAPVPAPIISAEEMPPAYNEIEWTVRVKQPRVNA